jgi:DNA-binding IclR family transcriptional regulator
MKKGSGNQSGKQQKGSTKGKASLVPAVHKAVQILSYLAKDSTSNAKLTEICSFVGIHKSRGYSILNTLMESGFVRKEPATKVYSLGPALIFLSGKALDQMDYREIVRPYLASLVKETGGTALLGLISGEHIFAVAKHDPEQAFTVSVRLGYRFPITYGALGKAIVAFLPTVEREKILESKENIFFSPNSSKLNMEEVRAEMAKCRQVGFALDLRKTGSSYNGIAAPLFGPSGKVLGALFLIGSFDFPLIEQYGLKLAENARKFSSALGADVDRIFEKAQKEDL